MAIINFRSIINKKADFLYFLQESKPRIIIGTETWLSNDIADNEIIPIASEFNYTIYRKDHNSGNGGVMIAVSKDILSSPVPELVTSCEMMWCICKLHFPGIKNVYICAYYRPHVSDQHSLNELNNSLAKLKEYNNNSIVWLAGDFNAPDINWESACIETGSNYPTIQTNLIDIIQDHGLSQVVMEPTRCSNILDLFLTNNPGQVQTVKILPGLSDHDIVSLQINCKPTILRQKPGQILLFNKANWEAFRSGLISYQYK